MLERLFSCEKRLQVKVLGRGDKERGTTERTGWGGKVLSREIYTMGTKKAAEHPEDSRLRLGVGPTPEEKTKKRLSVSN